jgi:hypothetical protein
MQRGSPPRSPRRRPRTGWLARTSLWHLVEVATAMLLGPHGRSAARTSPIAFAGEESAPVATIPVPGFRAARSARRARRVSEVSPGAPTTDRRARLRDVPGGAPLSPARWSVPWPVPSPVLSGAVAGALSRGRAISASTARGAAGDARSAGPDRGRAGYTMVPPCGLFSDIGLRLVTPGCGRCRVSAGETLCDLGGYLVGGRAVSSVLFREGSGGTHPVHRCKQCLCYINYQRSTE